MGVAAHIVAASEGGPRGSSEVSAEELRSKENAIWLCPRHSRMVDTEEGRGYPISALRAFKARHESKIAIEIGDTLAPFGWIESASFDADSSILGAREITFAKATLITGEMGVGKSTLCNYVSAACSIEAARDLHEKHRGRAGSVKMSLVYRHPNEHTVAIRENEGRVAVTFDGQEVPANPLPFGIVYLKQESFELEVEGMSSASVRHTQEGLWFSFQEEEWRLVFEGGGIAVMVSADGVRRPLDTLSGGGVQDGVD